MSGKNGNMICEKDSIPILRMDCQTGKVLEWGVPSQPLSGRTILLTRAEGARGPLSAGLRALGAKVLRAPVIRAAPPASWRRLDSALRRLEGFDAAVFASPLAVAGLFSRARALGLAKPRPPRRVFAVGPRTAQALRRRGWRARAPKAHHARALADLMGEVRGWNILLPRAAAGRELLPRLLRARGARVHAAAAYRTLPDAACAQRVRRLARSGGLSAVTFTSGSTVENFLELLPADLRRRLFRRAIAASIGPVTSAALRRRGLRPAVEASRATMPCLCRALARHFSPGGRR